LAVLMFNLPAGSRLFRRIGGKEAEWTPERTLLGLVVERLDALHHSFIKANGGRASKPTEVVPRPKPQRDRTRLPVRSTEDVLAGLDKAISDITGVA
jgi:hypothetical protein